MARIPLYTAVTLLLCVSTSIFATPSMEIGPAPVELIFKSSGMELVESLERMIGKEFDENEIMPFHSMVMASSDEVDLARAFDGFLIGSFQAVAKNPSEDQINWSVDHLFYIFVRYVGLDAVGDAVKQMRIKNVIRAFVAPMHERDPNSCVTLLDPQLLNTIN